MNCKTITALFCFMNVPTLILLFVGFCIGGSITGAIISVIGVILLSGLGAKLIKEN